MLPLPVVQNCHIMEYICLRQQLNLLYAHRPIAWANRTHPHLFIIVWWTGNNKQFPKNKPTLAPSGWIMVYLCVYAHLHLFLLFFSGCNIFPTSPLTRGVQQSQLSWVMAVLILDIWSQGIMAEVCDSILSEIWDAERNGTREDTFMGFFSLDPSLHRSPLLRQSAPFPF